jgi:hypothetical protein
MLDNRNKNADRLLRLRLSALLAASPAFTTNWRPSPLNVPVVGRGSSASCGPFLVGEIF